LSLKMLQFRGVETGLADPAAARPINSDSCRTVHKNNQKMHTLCSTDSQEIKLVNFVPSDVRF